MSSNLIGPPFWYSTLVSTLLTILSNDGNSNKTILPLEIMQSLLSFKQKHAFSFPDWLLLLSSSMSSVFCSFNMICIFLFILGFIGLFESMFWCLSSVVDNSQPLSSQILLQPHFLYSFLPWLSLFLSLFQFCTVMHHNNDLVNGGPMTL